MNWLETCNNPLFKNIPFKVELNKQGQVLMTPVKVTHSLFQGKIVRLLYQNLTAGEALVECAIATTEGTKVADVAWAFDQRLNEISQQTECLIAPEICIEVMSSSNTKAEMNEKKQLYFAQGAEEVWICDKKGIFSFFSVENQLTSSSLAPDFPKML